MELLTREQVCFEMARFAIGCYFVFILTLLFGVCILMAFLFPAWSPLDVLK